MLTKILVLVLVLLGLPAWALAQQEPAQPPDRLRIEFQSAPPLTSFAEILAREKARQKAAQAQVNKTQAQAPAKTPEKAKQEATPPPTKLPVPVIRGLPDLPAWTQVSLAVPVANESPPRLVRDRKRILFGLIATLLALTGYAAFIWYRNAPVRREMKRQAAIYLREFQMLYADEPDKKVTGAIKCFPREKKFSLEVRERSGQYPSDPVWFHTLPEHLRSIAARHPDISSDFESPTMSQHRRVRMVRNVRIVFHFRTGE